MSEPHNYGNKYWCIKSSLSKSGEIYINADRIEITATGSLICWGQFRSEPSDEGDAEQVMLAIQPEKWTAVFAASVMDGSAVAVQHWQGEVVR